MKWEAGQDRKVYIIKDASEHWKFQWTKQEFEELFKELTSRMALNSYGIFRTFKNQCILIVYKLLLGIKNYGKKYRNLHNLFYEAGITWKQQN